MLILLFCYNCTNLLVFLSSTITLRKFMGYLNNLLQEEGILQAGADSREVREHKK